MEIQIQKLKTQYYLPPGDLPERYRLDHLRTIVIERACETVFERHEISDETELCIRKLFVPIRLNLRGTDESIVANWSEALAAEISRSLLNGPTANVIVYHSRRQALLDMATNVARGDLSRAWAWRQLRCWKSSGAVSESQAIVELVDALSETATSIVPTLHALAQANLLSPLARRITEAQWQQLAAAALFEAGVAHLLEQAGGEPSSRAFADARRVLKDSLLLRALVSSGVMSGAVTNTRRAVAALVALEAEPAALRTDTAATLVGIIAGAIHSPTKEMIDDSQKFQAVSNAAAGEIGVDQASDETQRTQVSNTEPDVFANVKTPAFRHAEPTELSAPNFTALDDEEIRPAGVSDATASVETDVDTTDRIESRATRDAPPFDLRRRGFTRFGGLFFLLAVIEELGLPEQIIAHPVFESRPFLWVIHQLSLTLAPMESNDPAALAFAGLPPEAKPPSQDEPAPSESELHTLNTFVASITTCLALLLKSDDKMNVLLESLCNRRAQIVADPGWIEVRLSLDDVSTDIRRAGLDLNPGYVPWLGVVVVFVYE